MNRHIILYIVVIFITLPIVSVFTGSLNNMFAYRKSVDPDRPITTEYFLHFLNEYINIHVNKLRSGESVSTLNSFHISVDKKSLLKLNDELPLSGKSFYVSGHISTKGFAQPNIKLRYRGDLPFHWLYAKKSLRIKLPPFTTYRSDRSFNLVNPTTQNMVTDSISYDLSRSLGLLTPDYFPVRVFINNEDNGIHFYLSQPSESFLRKNSRMPGNIYSGDRIQTNKNNSGVPDTYVDHTGVSLLWKDSSLWKNSTSKKVDYRDDNGEISEFIAIANELDHKKFYTGFSSLFDTEKYYSFFAIDTIFGTDHHDYFHNHKVYFDPYKGTFEPISWDIRIWRSNYPYKDISFYPLLDKIKRNPILEYQRDVVGFDLLNQFTPQVAAKKILAKSAELAQDILSDPYNMAPSSVTNPLFKFEKSTPFTALDHTQSINEVLKIYSDRWSFMRNLYDNSSAQYSLEPLTSTSSLLTFSISGNSPVYINPYTLFSKTDNPSISINRLDSRNLVNNLSTEILYPGRKVVSDNFTNLKTRESIAAYGTFRLSPSPLLYKYIIKHTKPLRPLDKSITHNAITGLKLHLLRVDSLTESPDTVSIHPWELNTFSDNSSKKIILSGHINIKDDRIYNKNQFVEINPGTVFTLSPGKSIIFNGRVNASGNRENPIVFRRAAANQAWGSIIIRGKSASGSKLKNIDISGGSKTSYNLVNYPGQINIHNLDNFTIEQCNIHGGSIGDDSLHIAYSNGEISNCKFYDNDSDALDIDISNVSIKDSEFKNSGNDAIDLMNSTASISGILINNSVDKCFSIGEQSDASLRDITLSSCNYGIAVKDKSKADLNNIRFLSKINKPIALYQKITSYNMGGTISGNKIYGISPSDIEVSGRSRNNLEPSAFIP